MKYKKFIIDVLEESSKIALKYYGKVSGTIKPEDPNQVLTKADIEIGKYLISRIEKEFPDHNIIDEEAGVINKKSSFTWVTDPIDGTSNFAAGTPLYGIMIGLLKEDKAIAGGVFLPAFSEIYVAEKDEGAYCNQKPIKVTSKNDLKSVLVCYGIDSNQQNPDITREEAALFGEIALACGNMRISNSCFDTMMVAKGSYGGWLNKTSKIWDNVAQQIIIEEAGGIYTDFYGNLIDYPKSTERANNNFTQCIASPVLHKQLQAIIHKLINIQIMNYKGVIIEESLDNKRILQDVKILKSKVERVTPKHKTPWLKKWTLYTVEVPEEKADKVSKEISKDFDYSHGSAWYADFKNDKYHYIIYKNKIFKIDRSKPEEYKAATDYGISLGIPAYQVDFSPAIEEWKR